MPRLSITLTDSQAAALDRIAAETGATKQSMIGLAVSAWIREHDETSFRNSLRLEERRRAEARRNAQSDAELADWEEWDKQPEIAEKTPENRPQEPELYFTIDRDGLEVAWLRGRWANDEHTAIHATAMRLSRDGALQEVGRQWRYDVQEGETVYIEDLYPEDVKR